MNSVFISGRPLTVFLVDPSSLCQYQQFCLYLLSFHIQYGSARDEYHIFVGAEPESVESPRFSKQTLGSCPLVRFADLLGGRDTKSRPGIVQNREPEHHQLADITFALIVGASEVSGARDALPARQTPVRLGFSDGTPGLVLLAGHAESLARPFLRRREMIFRPPGVAIRALNPIFRLRLILDG